MHSDFTIFKSFTMYNIMKGLIFFFNSFLNFVKVKKNKENGGNSFS